MPGNGGGARVSASPAARVVAMPPPAHYLHELPAQDEERLERLFQTLDLDGNGRIDVLDLSRALREVGVHTQYAQVFAHISLLHAFYIYAFFTFIYYMEYIIHAIRYTCVCVCVA